MPYLTKPKGNSFKRPSHGKLKFANSCWQTSKSWQTRAFARQTRVKSQHTLNLQHGRRRTVALTKSCRLCLSPVVCLSPKKKQKALKYSNSPRISRIFRAYFRAFLLIAWACYEFAINMSFFVMFCWGHMLYLHWTAYRHCSMVQINDLYCIMRWYL